ncbi:MAG TPA: 2-C-methyl-D-erythritol 4-phosphate cytidylyltransferase, partial [Balneolales bacterium]|nr:2-C-methyl-D-erythritol 4-phosphate cytidylyltransferase [Balneolales bacterium]
IIEGGSDRQESVERGLEFVDDVDLVAVHDAVRPFVTASQIAECCKTAEEYGGAVLGIPARDTIKECDGDRFVKSTPDRAKLWQCQTPQIFRFHIFKKAFQYANDTGFRGTDDASIVEHMGGVVRMVQGDASNIKITYPQDMIFAEILMEQENSNK